jgi:gamma-glutamyl-gamma-aminobutyraldehyde dehydrogenase
MTSPLRHETLKIAGALKLPSQPFIDGGYRAAIDGKPFTSINPATGETLAEIEGCGVADVDAAVAAAKASFDAGC